MTIAAVFFAAFGVAMIWLTDYTFLTIDVLLDSVQFKGYFSIRKIIVRNDEIQGYEIRQKADQLSGFHEELKIVLVNKREIVLSKIAYEDYEKVREVFQSRFQLIGYSELKYGKLIGRLVTIIFIASGLLAGLAGLVKLINW
jgi:hypothetical protein